MTNKRGGKRREAELLIDVDGMPTVVEAQRSQADARAAQYGVCLVCRFSHATWRKTPNGLVLSCSVCKTATFLNSSLGAELWKAQSRSQREHPDITGEFLKAVLPYARNLDDGVKDAIYFAVTAQGSPPHQRVVPAGAHPRWAVTGEGSGGS